MQTPKSDGTSSPLARFHSLTKRLLAVPKSGADKQKALRLRTHSHSKKSAARG